MTQRLDDLALGEVAGSGIRWPLDDMLGAELVQAALARIEAAVAIRCSRLEVDPTLWLRLDSFSLLQALVHLARRLRDEFEIGLLQLRLQAADDVRAHLDLVWSGPSVSSETMMKWELDPMSDGADASPLTIRDVVSRHGGEFWFERDRAAQQAFFRFLLPLAEPGASAAGRCQRACSQREPARIFRFRSVRQHRTRPRARRSAAGVAGLYRVRYRNHRSGPLGRRRDHPDRRRPYRQRQAAEKRMFRAAHRPAAIDSCGIDSDSRHHGRSGGRHADAR